MEEQIVCSVCGKMANNNGSTIRVVSGKQKKVGEDIRGLMKLIKVPDATSEFSVCDDCIHGIADEVDKKRPRHVVQGSLLALGAIMLLILYIKFAIGLVDEDRSLWLNMGGGIQVLPWYAYLILVFVALIPVFFAVVFSINNFKKGFGETNMLSKHAFEEKSIKKVLQELKNTDKKGLYFACSEKDAQNIPTENKTNLALVRKPLPPDEEELLSEPCNVLFEYDGSVPGNLRVFVYLNGLQIGSTKKGVSISVQTGVKNNLICVVDHSGTNGMFSQDKIFGTFSFVAPSGGSISIFYKDFRDQLL